MHCRTQNSQLRISACGTVARSPSRSDTRSGCWSGRGCLWMSRFPPGHARRGSIQNRRSPCWPSQEDRQYPDRRGRQPSLPLGQERPIASRDDEDGGREPDQLPGTQRRHRSNPCGCLFHRQARRWQRRNAVIDANNATPSSKSAAASALGPSCSCVFADRHPIASALHG